MSAVIDCAAYAGGNHLADVKITDIGKLLRQADKFVWIGLYEPDAALLAEAQQQFDLHDLAIEDAHRAHQRPMVETYGESLFIVLRRAQVAEDKIQVEFGETHFFAGSNFMLTIRHGYSISYGGCGPAVRETQCCCPEVVPGDFK